MLTPEIVYSDFAFSPLDLFWLLSLIYIDLLNFIPASLPELRSYTKVLNHILTNFLVLIGFWTEPDLQYILNPTPICPSAINPDHYQIPSTMSPTPQHDISNWIAFQTQHMQIKLFILLPRWDFLNKFLGRVFFFFFQASRIRTSGTFKFYYCLLVKPYSLTTCNCSVL